jgi:hypothetical protein
VPIDDLPAVFEGWAAYERKMQTFVGPSGFTLFSSFNHGGWIKATEGSDPRMRCGQIPPSSQSDDGHYRQDGQQYQREVHGPRGPAPMVVALQWHEFSRL